MRILLDENLDWRLSRHLPGHDVKSVPLIGWAGTKNGVLLTRAEGQFDILVTMDSAMVREEGDRLKSISIAIIVLRAPSNRLADTVPLMHKVLDALPKLQPGTLTVVEQD